MTCKEEQKRCVYYVERQKDACIFTIVCCLQHGQFLQNRKVIMNMPKGGRRRPIYYYYYTASQLSASGPGLYVIKSVAWKGCLAACGLQKCRVQKGHLEWTVGASSHVSAICFPWPASLSISRKTLCFDPQCNNKPWTSCLSISALFIFFGEEVRNSALYCVYISVIKFRMS